MEGITSIKAHTQDTVKQSSNEKNPKLTQKFWKQNMGKLKLNKILQTR